MLLLAVKANSMRYPSLALTRLATHGFAAPGTDNYYFSPLLPIEVYLALFAVALLVKNRFERACKPLLFPDINILSSLGIFRFLFATSPPNWQCRYTY